MRLGRARFVALFDFRHHTVDDALRTLLSSFRLPGESQVPAGRDGDTERGEGEGGARPSEVGDTQRGRGPPEGRRRVRSTTRVNRLCCNQPLLGWLIAALLGRSNLAAAREYRAGPP